MKQTPIDEAVAAAVRPRYPQLQVEIDPVPGQAGWKLDIKGGTKTERDAAMAYAKSFAAGWLTGRK